eukprot:scaffold8957_cov85-Cylindrotheca_fusiformis.AAC.3
MADTRRSMAGLPSQRDSRCKPKDRKRRGGFFNGFIRSLQDEKKYWKSTTRQTARNSYGKLQNPNINTSKCRPFYLKWPFVAVGNVYKLYVNSSRPKTSSTPHTIWEFGTHHQIIFVVNFNKQTSSFSLILLEANIGMLFRSSLGDRNWQVSEPSQLRFANDRHVGFTVRSGASSAEAGKNNKNNEQGCRNNYSTLNHCSPIIEI